MSGSSHSFLIPYPSGPDRNFAGVLQSAIVPMPDPVLGERACCFVTVRPGAAVTLADVNAWLARHDIAKLKWPERLEIIDAMPLTPTRKIIKGELVKMLTARSL